MESNSAEPVGFLILEELKLIRQDMKEEVRSLKKEMLRLLGQHNVPSFTDDLVLKGTETIFSNYQNQDEVMSLKPIPENTNTKLVDHSVNSQRNMEDVFPNQFTSNSQSLYESEQDVSLISEKISPIQSDIINHQTQHPGTSVKLEYISEREVVSSDNLFEREVVSSDNSHSDISDNSLVSSMPFSVGFTEDSNLTLDRTDSNYMSPIKNRVSVSAISHPYPKTYLCFLCKKPFNCKIRLAAHARLHIKEKPHVCEHCYKCFTRRSNLLIHISSTHNIVEPKKKKYACMHCSMSFNVKSHLTTHTRLHTGERPFKCSLCGKGFTQRSHLKPHLRSAHGTEN